MSHDPIDHDYERGLRNRRSILGDAWVDRSTNNANEFNAEFQNLITRFAWHEIWGRPGLAPRLRRVIVLASTMALARWEEFELHVRAALQDESENGLSQDELKEVLMQAAIYSGVPAANTGFALAQHILRDLERPLAPTHPAEVAHPGVGREGATAGSPRLHYSVRAPRSGKAPRHTVVLSHALGCDLDMWDGLANHLARDCRVICYDHRGHGSSEAPPGPYTMADLADDAARLLRELDSGPVVWIGLSMGGMVGQELALRHPTLVSALVVANSTSSYPDAAKSMWQDRIATVTDKGVEAIADAVMGRYFHDAFRDAQPATVARFRRRVASTGAAGYAACCAAVAGVDTTARLPGVAVPALVIAGELDAGTPLAMSEQMAAALPQARLAIVTQASHLSAIEQPVVFAQLVDEFIANL
ncbi:bifunctional 4-carboxymuconolactone decarboxylase/3-oxoadipate enol-lactonase PcaCD [Massilia yuzhufengensis]|uniref:3-oxoadipate enol-lactonase n=1 Tax=Massilia yuzhufengensis TaxID=1164594 RepID=A0A1I1N2E4_9BURK|nr:alpha/beta fold hydrolase [Massilia yuzhufengensis]SFC91811.1 3-oxoadipate enol-lactonase [Massilia yuzhufengensis]